MERRIEGRDESASYGVRPPNTAVSVATVQQQEWECGVDRSVAFDSGRENEELGCCIVCLCRRNEVGVLLRVDELSACGKWREDNEHVLSE